jgi:hypothetical protein
VDLAGLIVAAAGVLTGLGAWLVSRRGQRETAAEKSLATTVARDRGRVEETQQALDTYVGLVETLRDESARVTAIADQMRVDLSDERRDHMTDNAAYGLIEQRCRAQSATLTEALNVLSTVVVNETALQLIQRTRGEITEHPHTPQPARPGITR